MGFFYHLQSIRDGLDGGQLSSGLGQVQSELCVSPSGNGGTNTEQNSPMQIINKFPVGVTVEALLLSTSPPLRFPVTHRTVVDLAQSSCHPVTPSGKAMRFVAWRLSGGDGPRVEDCPLGLNPLFCLAGRKARRVCMDWAIGTTHSFVGNINWTRLSRIQ